MVIHRTLTSPECGQVLGYAENRARELYKLLEAAGRTRGEKRTEVKVGRQGFYIDIRVAMPQVWILIDTKKCPTYVSGLTWAQDYRNPAVEVDDVEYFRSLFPKSAPTAAADSAQLAGNADQIVAMRATMFSGEMRKVVQVLQGLGLEVPYSYGASVTHGIYVAANGGRWVIKISSAGVFAYPMAMCSGKNTPSDLGYTPLPTSEPDEPIELLGREGIAAAYDGKSPFYHSCGWAFSESGALAANCFVGSKDRYSYSWLYRISIAADPDTGAPASASMALVEEGYIHGPRTTHMKYPRRDIQMALFSFDTWREDSNYVYDSDGPVFCFYDGESLQTYFYVFKPSGSYSTTHQHITDGRSSSCKEFMDIPQYNGAYTVSAIPIIQLNRKDAEFRVRDQRSLLMYSIEGPLGVGVTDLDEFGNSAVESWNLRREVASGRNEISNGRVDVLIVTGYEREAVYVATAIVSSGGGYSWQYDNHVIGRYLYDIDSGEICLATSDTGNISFIIKGIVGEIFPDSDCQSGVRYGANFPHYVFEGRGMGDTIYWRDQDQPGDGWNACPPIWQNVTTQYNPNNGNEAAAEGTTPTFNRVDYRLRLHGSGDFGFNFGASDADMDNWMDYIETGMNDQVAQIVRDAFAPQRAAYSPAVNKERGVELAVTNSFAPYSLATVTGAFISFVGVP